MARLPDPPSWAAEMLSVGVTGTNGKTTTTTFVGEALASDGTPAVYVTSVGSFLAGRERLRLEADQDYAGFIAVMREARRKGATRAALELTSEALAAGFARAWPCRIGVLTSFDRDHIDAHGSLEHYLASKAQLFVSLPPGGAAVLNAGDPAAELIEEVVPPGVRRFRYGLCSRVASPETLDLAASWLSISFAGSTIGLAPTIAGLPETLTTRAIGEVFAENALAALAAAILAGVAPAAAASAIAATPPPPGRFELVGERPWVVVDYAHTPDAVERTLASGRALSRGQLVAVLGAGGNRDRDKRRALGMAARSADRVIVTNDNPRDHDPELLAADVLGGLEPHPAAERVLDRARAIELAVGEAGPEDLVLLLGRGSETIQVIGPERRQLSDAAIAREAHARRAAALREDVSPAKASR